MHIRQDARRRALAQAAFDVVADRGIEGLRTRDVAARVGVNVATLHYYFATKEALVAGIVELLAEAYAASRPTGGAPNGDADLRPNGDADRPPNGALARLRAEWADARHDRFARPALQRVSLELRLRAERDPELRAAMEPLAAAWRHRMEAILADGVFEGAFRADLDVPATASVVLATLWGATSLFALNAEAFDAACAAIERMIAA